MIDDQRTDDRDPFNKGQGVIPRGRAKAKGPRRDKNGSGSLFRFHHILLKDGCDMAPVYLHPHLVGDLEGEYIFPEAGDPAVDPSGG